MSNTYFQFKQFIVHQDKCAMKVTTDACILGAWIPLRQDDLDILDIGSGTGLLALMLAQRNKDAHITGVEIERDAAIQAGQNFLNSPWPDRLQMVQSDIALFQPNTRYDLVVCNPPFFINSLTGPDHSRNTARHTGSLSYADLLVTAARLTKPNGRLAVLLPYTEFRIFEKLAINLSWRVAGQLAIKHTPAAQVKRIVAVFEKSTIMRKLDTELVIYEDHKNYTNDFVALMKPFYLNL